MVHLQEGFMSDDFLSSESVARYLHWYLDMVYNSQDRHLAAWYVCFKIGFWARWVFGFVIFPSKRVNYLLFLSSERVARYLHWYLDMVYNSQERHLVACYVCIFKIGFWARWVFSFVIFPSERVNYWLHICSASNQRDMSECLPCPFIAPQEP